jgi:AbiV family abortive infection protein
VDEEEWGRGFLESVDALDADQIEQACETAYANARDLLEEADLLRAKDRCARAYFLAHIACEELGKLPILTTVAVSQQLGHEVDWVRIDRVLRSHGGKIKQVLFMDSIVGQEGLERGKESYEADLKRMRGYTDMKKRKPVLGVHGRRLLASAGGRPLRLLRLVPRARGRTP